jgi:hypothetical protein
MEIRKEKKKGKREVKEMLKRKSYGLLLALLSPYWDLRGGKERERERGGFWEEWSYCFVLREVVLKNKEF